MDFPDDPAAIQRSKLIISDTTKDESSNEYIDPEIWANNHHKNTYSFTWILPAIFPDTLILVTIGKPSTRLPMGSPVEQA